MERDTEIASSSSCSSNFSRTFTLLSLRRSGPGPLFKRSFAAFNEGTSSQSLTIFSAFLQRIITIRHHIGQASCSRAMRCRGMDSQPNQLFHSHPTHDVSLDVYYSVIYPFAFSIYHLKRKRPGPALIALLEEETCFTFANGAGSIRGWHVQYRDKHMNHDIRALRMDWKQKLDV